MGVYNDKKMRRNFSKKLMNNICFEKEKPENYQEVVEIEKEQKKILAKKLVSMKGISGYEKKKREGEVGL